MAIPGRRRPVPTGLVVVRARDAPLSWGSGVGLVLSGFYPGIASQPPGARDARQRRAYEYMSAWIWHCYQAGIRRSYSPVPVSTVLVGHWALVYAFWEL